ncbi:hypothetical protein C7B61_14015 [filamentous cyanobacterium CCP1]|nr:hypothetical protein C7B76_02310 [filamentous cyanobacterium CCP2]PSB62893.1 hypothetical protein C7B61_14015 [filamentous cyanobacterium CCP1]
MSDRDQQKGYLASIAQSFDVGDFDYMSPEELRALDTLIANAWKTFKEGEDVNGAINEIETALGRKSTGDVTYSP